MFSIFSNGTYPKLLRILRKITQIVGTLHDFSRCSMYPQIMKLKLYQPLNMPVVLENVDRIFFYFVITNVDFNIHKFVNLVRL